MTDQEFRVALIQGADGLGNNVVADHLSVSHPTVQRWKVGKNLPHNALRPVILNALAKLKSGCAKDCEICKFYKCPYSSGE